MLKLFFILILILLPANNVFAVSGLTAFTVTPAANGGETYTVPIQILAMMTVLSLLPAVLIMTTSFTRIIIVLSILRQALGTAQTPSNQILLGLSLFLTFFIMSPIFENAYNSGVKPYLDEQLSSEVAFQKASEPFYDFMLNQTRETDLAMFAEISGHGKLDPTIKIPFSLLLPSFVTSELKTAFQIGFLIFIPFLIIDIVVASVLMSMGMMMLSPMIISLPFKLMLFVLIDGWSLIMGTLASSFYL
ncbi:Flagellar biosynthesis protein FliP [hydrothermal vent metagenome]|uniref:Flagellar biosynthetic protein FliP n=1 Tax=hydrothermal vent metagenome TaxID=652676 RepID=A0A3B0WDR6_9ZZZZ